MFALNVHAKYRCQHSGACCTAGWPIPVEPARRQALGCDILLPQADGACPFYDGPSRRCRVHREHGEALLPSSCFHFPRRALTDARGIFVSLSHFCPTAARLLVETDGPLRIVESPPAFPSDREYDGLDGRGAWPPLVKADLLFDHDSFDAWERFAIDALSHPGVTVTDALRRLAAAAEDLRCWNPGDGPLVELVRGLAARAWTQDALTTSWARYERYATLDAYESACSLVPAALEPPVLRHEDRERSLDAAPRPTKMELVAGRYVGAKLFGSWAAYEAFGLRTMVAELALAEQVFRVEVARARWRAANGPDDVLVEAVRAADWLLVHLVDRPALIAWLGAVERD